VAIRKTPALELITVMNGALIDPTDVLFR